MTDHDQWLEAMWRAYAAKVYSYAARRVGHDLADDVVADTFVVAWRRRGERPRRELPWLYGVARKVIGQRRRAAARRDRLAARVVEETTADHHPDNAGVSAREALQRLGSDDRETLMLVAWEGLTAAEAAASLGISRASYRMRLSRARRRLEHEMRSEGHMP